jgi:hypothetical protein
VDNEDKEDDEDDEADEADEADSMECVSEEEFQLEEDCLLSQSETQQMHGPGDTASRGGTGDAA